MARTVGAISQRSPSGARSQSCHGQFVFDMATALAEQLEAKFRNLGGAPLDPMNIDTVPYGHGVYLLYHNGELVYVGKAKSVRNRLRKHWNNIRGRKKISIADVRFKCLLVEKTWSPLTHEDALIKHFKKGNLCQWNGNGFGPNDPGRKREKTNKKPEGFDRQHPIDTGWTEHGVSAGTWYAGEIIRTMKRGLPYLFRYQIRGKKLRNGHPDYNRATLRVRKDRMPAIALVKLVARKLKAQGWQATVFPSHIILYKENEHYKFGRVVRV